MLDGEGLGRLEEKTKWEVYGALDVDLLGIGELCRLRTFCGDVDSDTRIPYIRSRTRLTVKKRNIQAFAQSHTCVHFNRDRGTTICDTYLHTGS